MPSVEYPQTCTSALPIFLNNLSNFFILLSSYLHVLQHKNTTFVYTLYLKKPEFYVLQHIN